MAKHYLSNIIDNLKVEDLVEIYSLLWNGADHFTEEDLKKHITKYIIQFYIFRHCKKSCSEKCKFLIEELKYREKYTK